MPRWMKQWWAWFALAFAVTVYGFWPSFFAALSRSDTAHVVHGFTATAWTLAVIWQAVAIRQGWRRAHRLSGYAFLSLAAVVVASGVQMIRIMCARPDARLLDFKFFWVDITTLILFAAFLWLAVRAARAKDFALHLRLVAATAIMPLEAALERVYVITVPAIVPDFAHSLYASLITLVLLTGGLVWAERRYSRPRWPFPAMLAYYLAMLASADLVVAQPGFIAFARWFSGA